MTENLPSKCEILIWFPALGGEGRGGRWELNGWQTYTFLGVSHNSTFLSLIHSLIPSQLATMHTISLHCSRQGHHDLQVANEMGHISLSLLLEGSVITDSILEMMWPNSIEAIKGKISKRGSKKLKTFCIEKKKRTTETTYRMEKVQSKYYLTRDCKTIGFESDKWCWGITQK